MTNVATLGIMGVLLTGGVFVLHHMLASMHEKNSVVALGVDKGVPVSLEYRWVTLFQMVVPVMLFTGVFALLMGFTFLRISAAWKTVASPCSHSSVHGCFSWPRSRDSPSDPWGCWAWQRRCARASASDPVRSPLREVAVGARLRLHPKRPNVARDRGQPARSRRVSARTW